MERNNLDFEVRAGWARSRREVGKLRMRQAEPGACLGGQLCAHAVLDPRNGFGRVEFGEASGTLEYLSSLLLETFL